MRHFIGCVVLLMIIAGCSSTEPVQQEETETKEPIQESPIPVWYHAGNHSSSDSLSFHGYSLASAMDSSGAADLSAQTALEYLRFEIDKTAEEVRKELAESNTGGNYNSPSFIIRLRNTISDLSLDGATITFEHETSETGVHYSYAKASISRTELPNLMESELDDEKFLQEIGILSQ